MATKPNTCAACGYSHLRAPQRSTSGGASHEICPSCGFEPGYTDDDQDITPVAWGKKWQAKGSPWFSKGIQPPAKAAVKKAKAKKAAVKKAAAKKVAKKTATRRKKAD